MDNKNLVFRYFIYFLTLFIFVFFVLDYFKEDKISNTIKKYEDITLKNYNIYVKELEKTAEFIYFNEFIRDKKLIDIFHIENKEELSKRLYDSFEPNFAYYKTLGLFDISFYSNQKEQILNFKDINFQDSFVLNLVDKVISTKEDIIEFKNRQEDSYIVFVKPIIDDKLNLVGVVNIEFDFKIILDKLNDNLGLNYKKTILSDKEDNENLIEIFRTPNNKNIVYLQLEDLKNSQDINKLYVFYDWLFIFCVVLLAFYIYVLYKIKLLKLQKDLVQHNYDELFDQVDNYVLKLDTDLKGHISYSTNYLCQGAGYSKDEIIGKNTNILRHPDISPSFYRNMWSDLKATKNWQGEVKNKDKFGNTYWVKAVLFPRYNFKNEHIGYSSIQTDITATKQLEKINKFLKDELSVKLNDLRIKDQKVLNSTKVALMSKILDSLSHQWQIPISKISFELQKLKKDNLIEDELNSIRSNIDLQLKELSDMLNEIKIIFTLRDSTNSNLYEVTKEIIESINYENIKIKYEIDENIKLNIAKSELRKIISNILKSIAEQVEIYSIQRVTIKLSIKNDSDDIVLKIEDNIKDMRKKVYLDNILKFEDEKYLDTKLYLAKLLMEKNQAIFWCNNSLEKTSYYIKFKKSKK
ncbi:PAS domain S-box protein [Arcobacter lanthieri]|uniref:PAS domain-containing protein n=1 Tax=Aliarcobacter lanthieri TaxID=1355374 RepID=UPI001921A14A|nr:PAS domain S-box protein [Aliarcobacter lanthieri]MBL3520565.1 PAS domain S-box protein [Aliarcobacter lanthieri]